VTYSYIGENMNKELETPVANLETAFKLQLEQEETLPENKTDNPSTAEPTNTEYPNPIPLPDALKPVKKLNPGILPDAFRGFVVDVSDRLGIPIDYAAMSLLASFSALVGARCRIQPKANDDRYNEACNNNFVLIGRPSSLKSPAMKESLSFLRTIDHELNDANGSELAAWKADEIERDIMKKALKQDAEEHQKKKSPLPFDFAKIVQLEDESEPPPQKRLVVNDCSVEALQAICADNPNGFLWFADELASLFAILNKNGNQNLRAFLLTAWNGLEPFTVDRIGRGLNQRIENTCFSILGSMQPGVLTNILSPAVSGGSDDDGLMQRFQLMVYPDDTRQVIYCDRQPDQDAIQSVTTAFRRIYTTYSDEQNAGVVFKFDRGAQDLYQSWYVEFLQRVRADDIHPALESHLSKMRKTVPTMALMFHLADHHSGPVCSSCFIRAMDFGDYLRSHAERIYGLGTDRAVTTADLLLSKIKSRNLPNPFKVRDVYRKHWSGLTDSKEVENGCELLTEHKFIFPSKTEGGRPTVEYSINPKTES
jgi:hypothetical protein